MILGSTLFPPGPGGTSPQGALLNTHARELRPSRHLGDDPAIAGREENSSETARHLPGKGTLPAARGTSQDYVCFIPVHLL